MKHKAILAFDCSTGAATVAVRVDDDVHMREIAHGQQAALLIPTIQELIKNQGVSYANLAAMVTTIGPGSFTGLRIALAALHALALASKVPVKTITSLQAVAHDVPKHEFLVALNAGKGEVFAQAFKEKQPVGEIMLVKPEAALSQSLPVYGNIHAPEHEHYMAGPSAATLCRIEGQLPTTLLADAMPLYIRPPDVKLAKPLPWLQTA